MGKKNKRKKNKKKNYQQGLNNQNLNRNFNNSSNNESTDRQDTIHDSVKSKGDDLNQTNVEAGNPYTAFDNYDLYENNDEDQNVHDAEIIEDDFHNESKFSTKNIITILIAVLMSIFLTFVILFSTGLLKKDNFSFLPFVEKTGSWQDGDYVFKKETNLNNEVASSTEESISNLNIQGENQKLVKLPVLMLDNPDMKLEGDRVGCDILYWIPIYVPNDDNIIKSTIQALFDYDQDFDFLVGNYVAKQVNLNFDNVIINDQEVNIYISGEITDLKDACDSVRLESQLTWVALQFDNIIKVSIYLNDELYSQTN